jgi:hypothetical protein
MRQCFRSAKEQNFFQEIYNIPNLSKKKMLWLKLPLIGLIFILSGCSAIQNSGACSEIRKESADKREIGITLIGKAADREVADDISIEEVEKSGYGYLLEGLKLVVANPQCFSEQEVRQAELILNPK